jgi:2'-5' RNA ligase
VKGLGKKTQLSSMNLPPIYGTVVWLLLSDESSRDVKTWMKLLRNKTESPFFVPHLTLVRPSDQLDEQQIIRETEKISDGQKPLRLNVTGIESGSSRYQAFYLKVEPSESLTVLHAKLENAMSKPGENEFNPHVSLLYGSLSGTSRIELEKMIQLPEQYQMTGNSLAVVRLNGTPEKWRIVHQSKLEG